MVICLERGADLHMAQLMPLPLTVSCFSKIQQTGFTFLVPAHLGSHGKKATQRVCEVQSDTNKAREVADVSQNRCYFTPTIYSCQKLTNIPN